MADSSKRPIRGGDLDALKRRLAQLQAEAGAVLDELNASAKTLEARVAQVNQEVNKTGAAEERVTKARAKRRPAAEDAAAKRQEATASERLAAAEERAAAAARARAAADQLAAQATAEAAAAVQAAGSAPRQLPRASAIPLGPTTSTVPPQYNRYGGIGGAPFEQFGGEPQGRFAKAMAAQTAGQREAAAAARGEAAALAETAAAHQTYIRDVTAGNAGLRTFDRAIETNILRLSQSGNEYQRNGYLTSEFINAAARGEVTIRELGTQIGGTIAKFAGWTAAAGAVYGVVRAIGQLGQGALASESGVNQLSRVVTNDLPGGAEETKQKFRDLSREFNLPIGDVTDAAYGMAKAFHGDLPQALEATKDALFAVKVGELSTADATRYLTAIINGFRLQPQQLHDVFDALNAVQNKFGGNIANVASGVAKAAGSFKAAGGDYLTLVKLVEAGVKVTGVSGENVGTAFSRSAGRVLTEAGRKAVADAGLNPDLNYPELFGQALAKSRGASPQTVSAIARSLIPSGGQFARILIPILQNPQLLGDIDKVLEQRAGSAERERQKLLRSPEERIKRLSTDAQQFGSALGESGALTPLLAIVATLDQAVRGLTQLVEVADTLAGPFHGALLPVLELTAALKIARRFDLGSSLPAGVPFRDKLVRPTGDLFDAQINRGDRTIRGTLSSDYRSSLNTQRSAAERANAAAAQARALEAELAATASAEEQAIVARKLEATQAANARYVQQADNALVEANLIQAEIVAREEQANRYRGLLAQGVAKEEAAVLAGYTQRTTLDTYSHGNPVPVGAKGTAGVAGAQKGAAEAAATDAKLTQALALETNAAVAVAEQEAIGAKVGLKALGVRLFAAVSQIGLAAFVLYEFVVHPIVEATRRYEEQSRKAEEDARSLKGGVDQARRNAVKANQGAGFAASIGEFFSHPFSGSSATDFEKMAQQLTVVNSVDKSQQAGKLLTISQIRGSLAERLSSSRDEGTRVVILRDALAQLRDSYIAQAEHEFGGDYKQSKGAKRALAAAQRAIAEQLATAKRAFNTSTNQIDLLDISGLQDFSGATTSRLQLQGPTKGNLSRLRGTLRAIVKQSTAGADPAEILKLVNEISTQATSLADRYSKTAGTPAAQARGRQHGIEVVRRALNRGQLERQLRAAHDEREAALKELAIEQRVIDNAERSAGAGRSIGGRTEGGNAGLRSLHNQAQILKDKAAAAGRKATAISQLLKLVFGALDQANQQAAADARAAAQALYDAKTDFLSASAGGGLAGDQVRLGREGTGPYRKLKKGSEEWYRHQAEVLGLRQSITDQQRQQSQDAAQKARDAAEKARQAAQQARDDAKTLISAQADYASSLTTDPVKLARIREREAERLARYASGRAEKLEAQANVNTTRRDYKNAVVQNKLDDIEYYASIGKLSHDAEIAQLGALLKRVKGNKDLRRQIRKQIYDLKHDAASSGDLELTLGDFKFPTAYEIRRAAIGASRGTNVTQHFDTRIDVSRDVDLDKLGSHVDRIHHGANKAIQRAAGLR